ncbi:hypothetical protein HN588_08305, partial [Candidatus Bathyarchaeota archaeon]|nr:hypothetical protein [Candidatus Bathyarchaeota archaeon]
CSSFAEGYAASAPPVTRKHWAPATGLSGDYPDRTYTGESMAAYKAHGTDVLAEGSPYFAQFPNLFRRSGFRQIINRLPIDPKLGTSL